MCAAARLIILITTPARAERDRRLMGHDLTRMLRAGMPPDWTFGERLIALVLADVCSDKTHTGYISNAQLCLETGYSPLGLRHALERLARRGYEFRVSVGTGSDGRLYYTNRGRATDYRVPILTPREKGVLAGTPSEKERRPREDLKASSPGPMKVLTRTPLPLQPLTTTNSEGSVVTPTGGRPAPDDGGASRLPIEQQAWQAIRERTCSDQTTSTPQTSTTITPGHSTGSAASSTPAA